MTARFSLLITFGLFFTSVAVQAENLTYPELVKRMTNLESLPLLPTNGEKAGLASSYDRSSQYDAANDKYINWGANDDGLGIVRSEGDTEVLAEIKGPGCIWRSWSAAADNGFVKIYLDGNETPVIDLPFHILFDPNKGPFHWPNLAYRAAGTVGWVPGSNLYVPIPFQKSCKIVGRKSTAEKQSGWGKYFQFSYTQFAPGTTVPTFTLPLSSEDSAALDQANTVLGQCGQDPAGDRPGQKIETPAITVPAGGKSTVVDLKGPEAITAIKVKLDLPQDVEAQRNLLRQLTIRITWDDEKNASVWSPLGDFFGVIGGAEPYKTLPVGLLDDGTFYSYWYMPFGTRAQVEIGNDSGQPVTLDCTIIHALLAKPISQFGRFHAKWHRDVLPVGREDRSPDWTMLKTVGQGRYVGTMLHVWNPRGAWWGEGDEKFFIDGEKFPSFFGTGSEDYFGYAWGAPGRFARPFHAQPIDESNLGDVENFHWHIPDSIRWQVADNVRWHIADSIPFQASFDGYIEKYFPNESPRPYEHTSLFAVETYWYLSVGGSDPFTDIPVDQRVGYWTTPVGSYVEPGVIEGEDLRRVHPEVPQSIVVEKMWDTKPGFWSNDEQLMWLTPHPPGIDKLELKVPITKSGAYKFSARLGTGAEGGTYQLTLDGKNIGAPVDLYAAKLGALDPIDFGKQDLQAGDHVLGATLTGKNPDVKNPDYVALRLDYIKLVPAP